MADAQFTFASMIHRGFLSDENATTDVTVDVPGKVPVTRQVPMMTPGDVIGIPSRQVIRCTPVNGLIDAEPNYLATIEFEPDQLCLESKSLKLYLASFRNEGVFCEALAVRIRDDVAKVLELGSERVTVTLVQKARGGITITATA